MPNRTLRNKLRKSIQQQTAEWLYEQDAYLGNHSGTVTTGTPGVLYARLINGAVVEVHNSASVPADFDLHVRIAVNRRTRRTWQIIKVIEEYDVPATGGRINYHHGQHELGGADEVQVNRKQIIAYTVRVLDAAAFTVRVYGGYYQTATGYAYTPTQTLDLSSYVVTLGAMYLGIEVDTSGTLSVNDTGTNFGAPTAGNVNYFPTPAAGKRHLAAVLMYEGQTALSDDNIVVPMPLMDAPATNYAFGTVAVSGQSDVVADTTSDTLTLVAGTNMTITTDATGDSITFDASSSASVWSQIVNESGASFTNFTGASGTWSSDGTVIKQTDTAATFYRARYNTKVDTTNIIVEAEIQLKDSGTNRIGGIIVGFDGSNAAGLVARINQSGTVDLEIDNTAARFSVSSTISVDTWYKLRLVVAGDRFTAYLDGTLLGTAAGGNTAQSANASYIGLVAYQSQVWYRNIKAWTMDLPA